MDWKVPPPSEVFEVPVAGSSVFVRRYGTPRQPRLILCHGNGLAIDAYYPFWSELMDFDLFLYDLRNHGWNPLGDQKKHNIPTFASDYQLIFEAINLRYGEKFQVGVFHSLSAVISLVSSVSPDALMLFDLPLYRPRLDEEGCDTMAEWVSSITLERADRFEKRESLVDLLGETPPFAGMVSGARELMSETLLRPSPTGGYQLRCPREYESQVAKYARTFFALIDFNELPCPTKVLGSDLLSEYAYCPSRSFEGVVALDYDFLPDTTHMLILERPKECAQVTREFIAREMD